MKNYEKRINILINDNTERQLEVIREYIKNIKGEDCGTISKSDAIRYAVEQICWQVLDKDSHDELDNYFV